METIIIIGAGASGMMAALTVAGVPGRRVILLERQQRAGRKLLATGNGRCNLTNTGASLENYHGESRDFAAPALDAFPPQAVLDFFHGLGLVTVEEYGGRVYPLSDSANSVLDVLRFHLEAKGVELKAAEPAREVKRDKQGFTIVTDSERLHADKLIIACGGAAGAKLGGVSDGYELLKMLGHKRTALYPSLVQLVTAPEYPRALKGVRADCALRLYAGENLLAESGGELQFIETGVSGPAVFDLSRAATTGGKGLNLAADFLQDHEEAALFGLLKQRCETLPALPAGDMLTGIVHNRLGKMLIKYAGLNAAVPLWELNDRALRKLAKACKDFRLPVQGTEGFDKAQVTAGGVKTSGFNPETLESWFVPGLYACGEVLDIDGDCGGYNLQWAWASGRLAGRLGT
ncbi:MAG: aminoacetone oxidase family FAD-binding enzyme, partial [Oscillospiraceae bacterium]|nr:aminoacetone oxidase family FAD-binding enzyme [Oscillospiraceae bacterium]